MSSESPLSEVPEEIIETIAECLRYPILPQFEATERFLTEGATYFSTTRFYLSTFSQVSKQVRSVVERYLYRDIHVDMSGWTGRKHPMYPVGSLQPLLRTLEDRPELHRFVRSVGVQGLLTPALASSANLHRFLRRCPGLQSLWFSMLPDDILVPLRALQLEISSLAALTSPESIHRVVEAFPHLRNAYLHIRNFEELPMSAPPHRIETMALRVYAEQRYHAQALRQALELPQRARDVRVEMFEVRKEPLKTRVVFPVPRHQGISDVDHLTLVNVDVFTTVKVNEGEYYGLAGLRTLRHLHLVGCFPLPSNAFQSSSLPHSLRSLTFSDYAQDSSLSAEESKSRFVLSVVEALRLRGEGSRKFRGVKTYGARRNDAWELGDLTPLEEYCRMERVPLGQIGSFADIQPQLILFFG
ncbi:Yae1-N domain-containing protein [Mycena kentingensis (nom. inval.)]|nr:Yae1-N domain-containing protein [Mycena kentingensis (nom. inval.)]